MTAHFAKLKRAPAYKILAEAIVEQILERRLRLGDQLPTEHNLAEQFGVNRSTVREGIRLLEETGLVQRKGGKRLIVTRPSYDAVGNQMGRAMLMHEVTFRELWQAMMAVEPAAAELAARNANDEQFKQFVENLQQTKVVLSESKPLAELDIEFHSLVAQAASNKALLLAREPMVHLFYPAFDIVLTKVEASGKRLLTAHKAIFAAIRARNAEKAREQMMRHIKDFKRGCELAGLDVDRPVQSNGAGVEALISPAK